MTRILIVDDNPTNIYLLESILKGNGFEVVSTKNGADALAGAKMDPPDLVITDILMPVMDGFELCRQWKVDEHLRRIPLVFYTATYTEPKDEQLALSLGAERFLIKPQKPDVLVRIIREVLEDAKQYPPGDRIKPPGEDLDVLRQYNEVLFHKLEKKVADLERELSERTLMEEKIRFLASIVESSDDAIIGKTLDGTIVSWNTGATILYGYTASEVTGKPISILIPPGEMDELPKILERIRKGETISHYETRRVTKTGSMVDVSLTISPIRNPDGRLAGASTIARDITQRKETERALRDEKEFSHLLLDASPAFWVAIGTDGKTLMMNRAMRDALEYSEHEVRGADYLTTYVPAEDREELITVFRKNMDGITTLNINRLISKTGKIYYVEWRGNPVKQEEGKPGFFVGVGIDITDRMLVREKLVESEARYSRLHESMRDAFIWADLAGKILEYNLPFRELIGFSDEELTRTNYKDLIPEKWREFFRYLIDTQVLPHGYSPVFETEMMRKEGTTFPAEVRVTLVRDAAGVPTGMWAIVRDISERKKAEELIRITNIKLALMRDVTYQDIQNKVTALRGYVDLWDKASSNEERIKIVGKIHGILGSIHGLIIKTKDYQQMGIDKSRWILVEPMIRSQFSTIAHGHQISLEIDLHGLELFTDALIERVFYNLIQNTIIHGGNATRISFTCQEANDGLLLTCEDDGAGITRENKPHIFDRVVAGEGKFGLFFVREFLSISGMTISESGEPETGALFLITIPKGIYRFSRPS